MEQKKYIVNGLTLFFVATSLFLLSCDDGTESKLAAEMKNVNVCFNFTLEGEVTPITRSVAFTSKEELGSDPSEITTEISKMATKAMSVNENSVKTLWLGQYDASGNLLISHYLNDVTGNTVQVQLKESPNCSLRFVGNVGDLGKIATLTEFNETKINYVTGTGGLTTSAGLPVNLSCAIFAQLDNQSISINYEQTIQLTRMVTKIQLNYTIKSGFTFTLKQLYLRSVPTQMQCNEPTGQVPGVAYQSFTVTPSSDASGTVEWYMPENKAGIIASGKDGYAASMRDKKGSTVSVPNATYIELVGDATVNGTTYKDVSFRIYPGNGINDYNLKRNTPYVVNLTLSGIDFSDPRVSVTVPDIVAPAAIDAAIDSTTTLQVTTRPGVAWVIALPDWLSAVVDGKENVPSSGILNYKGPAEVLFKAVSANPDAKDRKISFDIDVNGIDKNIEVIQEASVFTAAGTITKITKEVNSSAVGSVTATAGLKWTVSSETNNGITVSPTSGSGDAVLTFTASANTGAERLDSFTVSVVGADPVRKVTVKAIQEAGTNVVTINNAIVESFKKNGPPNSNYRIFNYDGGSSTEITGSDLNGNSQTRTLTKEYIIEVEKTERGSRCANYAAAVSYCKNKSGGWRVPTLIELHAMYENQTTLMKNGVAAFMNDHYWSSSNHRFGNERCTKNFANGSYDYWNIINTLRYVRCVRDKND
ncbi:DUF4906 domain-containing protein [Parabacteroides timonensis]|uniref:DUF4906 domain-containing protein n=1 Tax=Parabacteroides timonensis TaxID=1871013 RepID=UPI00094EACEB|nr:DUF4906 domain-containing protein [Parabacteroides timonensis]